MMIPWKRSEVCSSDFEDLGAFAVETFSYLNLKKAVMKRAYLYHGKTDRKDLRSFCWGRDVFLDLEGSWR